MYVLKLTELYTKKNFMNVKRKFTVTSWVTRSYKYRMNTIIEMHLKTMEHFALRMI